MLKSDYKNTTLLEHEYSPLVVKHFLHPVNTGDFDSDRVNSSNIHNKVIQTANVGTIQDGGVVQLQIELDNNLKITDSKFRAHGCVATIASASWASEQIIGKTIEQALAIKAVDIAQELNLPKVKFYSAILVEDAIQAALSDFIKG